MSAINETDMQEKEYEKAREEFTKNPLNREKSFIRTNEDPKNWNSRNPVFRKMYSNQYSEIMAAAQNVQGALYQQEFFGNGAIYAHGVAMGDQNVSDVMKQMNEKLKRIKEATNTTEFSTTFGINQHVGKMGFLVTGNTTRGSNKDLRSSLHNKIGSKFNLTAYYQPSFLLRRWIFS